MALGGRIDFLVVDDSESAQLLIARMLKSLALGNMHLASNARQALFLYMFKERMRGWKNAIVLLDINLPDLSGNIMAKKMLVMGNSAKLTLPKKETWS